jgi:hypothetical protein
MKATCVSLIWSTKLYSAADALQARNQSNCRPANVRCGSVIGGHGAGRSRCPLHPRKRTSPCGYQRGPGPPGAARRLGAKPRRSAKADIGLAARTARG